MEKICWFLLARSLRSSKWWINHLDSDFEI